MPKPIEKRVDGGYGCCPEYDSILVLGDESDAPEIARRSKELGDRTWDLIARADYSGLYGACSRRVRSTIGLDEFAASHGEVVRRYGIGLEPFVSVQTVYADAASRRGSNRRDGWPGATEGPSKRAIVYGVFADEEGDHGFSLQCWVVEEEGEYRIEKLWYYQEGGEYEDGIGIAP